MRFPEFTGEWKRVYIADILTIGSGKDYKGLDGGNIPVYGTGGYMTSVDGYLYDGESVCIGRKGTINKPMFLKGKFWTVDTLFFTHLFRGVIPKFSFYLFENINWLKYNEASGVPSLSKATIESIQTKIPSITEQEKIARFLSLIDERISTQNKIIAHLESLIKGLCLDVYERCEKIPYKISEIGHKHTTINLSKEELSDNGRNCIIYGELFTTYGCVIDVVQSKTTKNCTPKSLSKGNDILFPSSTTVDATSLISPSALKEVGVVLGGDMFSINVNNSHNCEAISYIINNVLKNKLARYAQGSTIIHIYYDDIKDYTLMLPVKEKQNLLANIMHCISTKISTEKDILSFYLQQKGYLLQNMFI